MTIKVCINCGGTTFISDRSLGGRLVCKRCGSYTFRNSKSFNINNHKFILIIIALIVFILIIQ